MAKRDKNLVLKLSQEEMQVLDRFIFNRWMITKSKVLRCLIQRSIAFEMRQILKVSYKDQLDSYDFSVKFHIEFSHDSLLPCQIKMLKVSGYGSPQVLKNIDVDEIL